MATTRLAVWSGPRNLSTALMYSFGQRTDCAIWDEPFYGAYLAATGLEHPMRAEILLAQDTDPVQVAARCAAPVPHGKPVQYLKLMSHHMLPGVPRDWMADYVHVLLIRHPARVLASYAAKRELVTLDDIGFVQQAEIDGWLRQRGQQAVVVDSADIRTDPEGTLGRLCAAVGLEFDPAMLGWPSGGMAADGIWAAHWYDAAHRSTGFAGPEGPLPGLTGQAAVTCEAALPIYVSLGERKL